MGKQELEIRVGNDHIAFEVRRFRRATMDVYTHAHHPSQTAKIGSLVDIQDSEDPEGLRVFYYLVQDLRVRIVIMLAYSTNIYDSVSSFR